MPVYFGGRGNTYQIRPNSRRTVIYQQNNYYNSCFGHGYNSGYGYGCNCNGGGGGMSKFGKWMLGLGGVFGLAGILMKLFGKNKPDNALAGNNYGNYEIKRTDPSTIKIKAITGAGAYQYAKLYKDENGNLVKDGTPEAKEISEILMQGNFEAKLGSPYRIIRKQVTLADGRVFNFIEDEEERDKVASTFKDCIVTLNYGEHSIVKKGSKYEVYDQKQNKKIGTFDSEEQAMAKISTLTDTQIETLRKILRNP